MNLPFTIEQFLNIFKIYNDSIFPAQIFAYVLGVICIILIFRTSNKSSRIILVVLGLYWLWMGVVYHLLNFTQINNAAYIFGAIFIIQGLIFLYIVVFKNELTFKFDKSLNSITGIVLIIYAMFIYPLIGMWLGHSYPNSPVFGVAPCPTTIFTFGILLQVKNRLNIWIYIIPLIWSVIGFFAAIKLGITEDVGLLISGLITGIILFKQRN
ncbi:MAG: DUF6064 family protein [Candidatus Kapabacteria bacterium]|nr:DUF6064 family protein [Candidatus Kapabacteria bacterium]